jgi:hypothetical protein
MARRKLPRVAALFALELQDTVVLELAMRTKIHLYHEPLATSLRLCNQSLIHSLDRTDIASVRAKMHKSRSFQKQKLQSEW